LILLSDLFRLNRKGSLCVTSAGRADYLRTRGEMLERAADLFSVLKSTRGAYLGRSALSACRRRARIATWKRDARLEARSR
jgi:hypothetical protein